MTIAFWGSLVSGLVRGMENTFSTGLLSCTWIPICVICHGNSKPCRRSVSLFVTSVPSSFLLYSFLKDVHSQTISAEAALCWTHVSYDSMWIANPRTRLVWLSKLGAWVYFSLCLVYPPLSNHKPTQWRRRLHLNASSKKNHSHIFAVVILSLSYHPPFIVDFPIRPQFSLLQKNPWRRHPVVIRADP